MEKPTFEELARQCGDALLVVARSMVATQHEPFEIAVARLGDWCVLPAVPDDIPRTSKRRPSKTRTFIITHVPTGFKLGDTMTRKDALATLVKLAPIPAGSRVEIESQLQAIYDALPVDRKGSIPQGGAGKVRSDMEQCICHDVVGGFVN